MPKRCPNSKKGGQIAELMVWYRRHKIPINP